MSSMTAQLAVGTSDRYHGGILPTHLLWLRENSRPAWTLQPTGTAILGSDAEDEANAWTVDPVIWIPARPETILEDALLMIGLHVIRDDELVAVVEEFVPGLAEIRRPFVDAPLELERFDDDTLADLRGICAATPRHFKLLLTAFADSSIRGQLPVLERYPMELEVCTLTYSREAHGFGGTGPLEPRGSLTAGWPGDDPPGHRYHDIYEH